MDKIAVACIAIIPLLAGRGARKTAVVVATSCLALAACQDDHVHTLYRTSPASPDLRIHIATFDADIGNGEDYNESNCLTVQRYFARNPETRHRYRGEVGYAQAIFFRRRHQPRRPTLAKYLGVLASETRSPVSANSIDPLIFGWRV